MSTSVMNAPWQPPAPDRPVSSASSETGILIDRVRKVYAARRSSAEVVALDDISLSVPKGSILGVIGRSGAGKSTLIRLINGLDKPTGGRVVVNGVEITALSERELRGARRSIGMVFQHFNLLSSRTAYGNVALPLEIAGTPKAEIDKRVLPLLDMVGLADKRDRYPAELSGGQKQRVGIARALATEPSVLLSDEATSALDPETTDQILELLKQINRDLHLTILFITHEMAVVKALADRVAVIEGGRIVEDGGTFDVFATPRHEVTRRFVSSVTGSGAPDWLVEKLQPSQPPGGQAVLRITFKGSDANQPLLSRVTRELGVDLNILSGQVEMIAGHPFGTLIVSLDAAPDVLRQVIAQLSAGNNLVEQLGYVA
ncbi:methionine ABC transporter ATP-binding protein [Rhodopseudomonas sp. AAP120]|uniref:methionine ABC transporter ATP-binding protein n=1 Tax=Rhodopseudomonas sp. AAP120 TaxID=1523430 RepID=UPI0018D00206|nr:methionine ABC transporter ATP-binding protein [Rhodopseudomonas sp. AAP120]